MKHLLTYLFLSFFALSAQAQYCVPNPGTDGCTDGDLIDNFILYGENGTSIVNISTGCSPNAYNNLIAQSITLGQNTTYVATISTQFEPDDNIAIWIDFNDDDVFDILEMVGSELSITVSGSPVSIAIPSGAALGSHRMRVMLGFDVFPLAMDPCNINFPTWDFGEVHDYIVNIVPQASCIAPGNLSLVSVTQNSASLSWTGSAPQYGIEYGPLNFVPGTGTYVNSSTNSVTLSPLNSSSSYTVYVHAICSPTDSSSVIAMNFNTLCGPVNVPYTQSFDGVTMPNIPVCMTVQDANSDLTTWSTQNFLAQSAPNALLYESSFSQNADDWIFTPGINVVAGETYQVSFSFLTEGSAPESLEVKSGSAPNALSMTGAAIYSNNTLTNTTFVLATTNYTAATTGVVYFGWHIFSDMNSFGMILDDINITSLSTVPCDTSLSITASGISATEATLSWTTVAGATGYQYVLDQVPTNPSGAGTPTLLTTFPATGLTPNATYYFHLRTDCGSGLSAWKTISFSTLPVSVKDVANTNATVSLYPNPVKDFTTVVVSNYSDDAALHLTDISGRILKTLPVSQNKTAVDMTGLSAGVYFIRYNDGNYNQTFKVVKE